MERTRSILMLALAVACLAGGSARHAVAFSQSNNSYYDAFGDLDGIDPAYRTQVQINHLGGLRMKTVGPTATQTWTTKADFDNPLFVPADALLAQRTLAASAAGDLTLRSTPWSLRQLTDGGGVPYVLRAPPAAVGDNFSVGGMAVVRVDLAEVTPADTTLPSIPAAKYYMFYTGVPEDQFAQKIYLATSGDGANWERYVDAGGVPIPVLALGPAGAFDARQLGKPWVVHDPANTAAPFRMWYTAEGDFGGGIGYAVSAEGVTWTKHTELADPLDPLSARPVPVLAPGRPGQADSYAVSQPCVVVEKDGAGAVTGYKMWYTANDGNNLRVSIATSADGIVWQRGGIVVDLDNSNHQSIRKGAWSPSVLRNDDGTYAMALTGYKDVAGGAQQQSSIVAGTSADGFVWSLKAKELIAQQGSIDHSDFAGFNVSQPALLYEADAATGARYKLWFVGNVPDANDNYHDRIGFAVDGPEFTNITDSSRVNGPAGDPFWLSVFTLEGQSTAFDSMNVADLRAVSDGTNLYGFFTGTNAADFVDRVGVKSSADGGLTWTDVLAPGVALIDTGAGAFDAGGVSSPAPIWDPARNAGAGGWLVYHTALSAAGTPTIALHTAIADLAVAPVAHPTPVLAGGSGFDAGGCADPYAVVSGADVVLFYAGRNGAVWSIGRTAAPLATPETFGERTLVLAGDQPYDLNGVRDPVVLLHDGTWYLWYTAIGSDKVERVALATSADGTTFTKQGLALNPSTVAYDIAERGIRPADARYDTAGARLLFSYTGVDRFGWKRIGLASSTGAGYLEDGTATFELWHDPAGANPQADWRKILWTATTPSAATTLEIWASYFPTVKGLWSTFFPVTSGQDLPFGLEVERMRWQVRLKSVDPAATPVLSQLDVQHAPIQFAATAQAQTIPITPAAGNYLLAWKTLTVETDLQAPQGGSVTLEVRDQDSTTLLAAQPLVTGVNPPIDLGAIPVTSGGLRLLFAFTPDTATYPPKSPLVRNFAVTFDSTLNGSQLTLVATPPSVVSGGTVTLSGALTGLPSGLDPVPLAGQGVVLKRRAPAQTAWTTMGTLTTAADGSFTTTAKPGDSTIYRVEWTPPAEPIGGVAYPPAVASVQVRLAPRVTILVSGFTSRAGKYYVYPPGRLVGVKGKVIPAIFPGSVTVRVQRLAAGKWSNHAASKRALTAAGAYAWSWRPRAAGNYRVSARFPGDAYHPPRSSAYLYFRVQ